MALLPFYNLRKPRQFNHKPIYWNPNKEALEDRIRKIEVEMGVREETVEEYKPNIKGSFVAGTSHLKKRKAKESNNKRSSDKNTRLLLILLVLVAILWYFFLR